MQRVTILILAAGASSRMAGADKLMMPVDGVAQLRRVALAAAATGCPVVVAVPRGFGQRHDALQGLAVTIAPVAAAQDGMAASIRAGAAACAPGQAVMIVPADMPELSANDFRALIAAHLAAPQALLRGADHGRPGHPVLIPQDLVADLQGLQGDQGARGLIAAHPQRVVLVELPAGHATLDLDTPQDWVLWLGSRQGPAQTRSTEHPSMRDPLKAALDSFEPSVLAVITGVSGASYRRPGALMALFAGGGVAGSLTNGCIEGDLAVHAAEILAAEILDTEILAAEVRATGHVRHLRYGTGSPFFDIRLPCGGGLDVALFARPDLQVLAEVQSLRAGRGFFALRFDAAGQIRVQAPQATGWDGTDFVIDLPPPVRFAIFGDGPEAVVFTRMVHSLGHAHRLVTGSRDTFDAVRGAGAVAEHRTGALAPALESPDARTAVVTFFHDHDQEIPILAAALASPAFYVGAQGSHQVALRLRARLQDLGVSAAQMARLRSPIGLIPSARDPQTLAISVLAEIVQAASAD